MEERVILVDINDSPIGEMGKLEAHQKGELHRAFSIFIFNSKGELLLQQRALDKYHSGGLWTNTCCSHQRPGEDNLDAANRRLMEEMGMKVNLTGVFNFTYRAEFENGLIEHEFDYVFFGKSDLLPVINKEEVEHYKYISMDLLEKELLHHQNHYTPWLKICLDRVIEQLK
ncbi:isopentenyl-diphosphate Delta-isomerase [Pedobacter petrophilus]|uniref:Isopentenyl-diphosphate delta-isomerase n=1 Tax=Pedobacter petrophilus TaxID=1908241 RepID=A0A7K0FY50_9SPHI|nr:isopentenyl-diphosphate Delta-isomerase [Pedobacter petrophilus]MRX75994.1 isopentenyl-diphosphate Delta-isomerase [Pedobacter petrophilus]